MMMRNVKLSICDVIFCNPIKITVTWATLFFYENNVKVSFLSLQLIHSFVTQKVTVILTDDSASPHSNIRLPIDAKALQLPYQSRLVHQLQQITSLLC